MINIFKCRIILKIEFNLFNRSVFVDRVMTEVLLFIPRYIKVTAKIILDSSQKLSKKLVFFCKFWNFIFFYTNLNLDKYLNLKKCYFSVFNMFWSYFSHDGRHI